ncbi:hypothetical protein [Bradyrhizobium sp. CCBAU 51753]|uniref:hypothetical protein n=1 Tax=Bradyrhizobium sp. CCBAU 51753 TaxID=1325100 RepID=UPI001889DDBD|nr:hypothetical protein [Bradyrhizobium sp. CCBAU 51753]QOZ25337.1 hypothetical protein XH93_18350 [Bradyrhizobium sp. CCBAU 51753]
MTNTVSLGAYAVTVGALFHLIFLGPVFDWSSAWSWVWLVGWPLIGCVSISVIVLGVVAAARLIVACSMLAGEQ